MVAVRRPRLIYLVQIMLSYLGIICEDKRTKAKTTLLAKFRHLNSLRYHKTFPLLNSISDCIKNWMLTMTDDVT